RQAANCVPCAGSSAKARLPRSYSCRNDGLWTGTNGSVSGWMEKVDTRSALVPDRVTSRNCHIQFLAVDVPSSCRQMRAAIDLQTKVFTGPRAAIKRKEEIA